MSQSAEPSNGGGAAAGYDDLAGRVRQARLDVQRWFRPTRAAAILTELAEESAKLGDDRALGCARLELAAVARYQRELNRANELAEDALRRFEHHQNTGGQAAAHLELAKIDLEFGRDPEPHLERARSGVLDPSREFEARVDYVKARAALRQGKFSEALRLLRSALKAIEGLDHCDYYYARYLAQLGLVERLRGADVAQEHLQRAKALADKGGYLRVQAACLLDLGQITLKQGKYRRAHEQLSAAAALYAHVDDELGAAHAGSALGAVWRMTGHLSQAIESLERARDIFATREHLAGEALAHRRLAQCYADMLDREVWTEKASSADHLERATEEIAEATRQFKMLGNLDGTAVALATKARLLYQTQGAESALESAMAAVDMLGEVRGQFRQGVERFEFCRLHAWVFGLAMLCAAESNDVAKALRVAAMVRAETLGGAARQTLAALPGALGDKLREIFEHEQALRPSGSEAVPLTVSVSELRKKRDDLVAVLEGQLAQALTPPLERARLGEGQYRLCVYIFDDGLYVLCEGPARSGSDVKKVELSEMDRLRIEAAARADINAVWDARPRRWERLGELIVPPDLGQLRSDLLHGRVQVLEIEAARQLVAFPFGAVLLDGHPLDDLTCVLLSPSDPPWLRRRRAAGPTSDTRPKTPAPQPQSAEDIEVRFHEIVSDLVADDNTIPMWNAIELVEIAAGDPTLKRLFTGDSAVASHFYLTVDRHLQDNIGLLDAVRLAKMSHRRACGETCPPAHVGVFAVAGRLPDVDPGEEVGT